jgi:hypothetical protein
MLHFSALAFLSTHNFDEFVKLILFNLFIIVEPSNQQSMCLKKPTVYFDNKITQSLIPSKLIKPTKPLAKPTKPAKPAQKPLKSTLAALATPLAKPLISDDVVEELYSQIEGLELDIKKDLKAKKKAKAAKVAHLATLSLQGVMEEAKPLKDVQFEPFNLRVL